MTKQMIEENPEDFDSFCADFEAFLDRQEVLEFDKMEDMERDV